MRRKGRNRLTAYRSVAMHGGWENFCAWCGCISAVICINKSEAYSQECSSHFRGWSEGGVHRALVADLFN